MFCDRIIVKSCVPIILATFCDPFICSMSCGVRYNLHVREFNFIKSQKVIAFEAFVGIFSYSSNNPRSAELVHYYDLQAILYIWLFWVSQKSIYS